MDDKRSVKRSVNLIVRLLVKRSDNVVYKHTRVFVNCLIIYYIVHHHSRYLFLLRSLPLLITSINVDKVVYTNLR